MTRPALLALSLAVVACATTSPSRPVSSRVTSPPVVAETRQIEAPPEPRFVPSLPALDVPVERVVLLNGLRVAVSPMPEADRVVLGWVVRGAGYGDALPPGAAQKLAEAVAGRAERASRALPGEHEVVSLAWRAYPTAALFWTTVRPSDIGAVIASFAAAVRGLDACDFEPPRPSSTETTASLLPWERLRYDDGWNPRTAALGSTTPPSSRALLEHFHAVYSPTAVSLVAAGAVTPADVSAWATPLLGAWRGAAPRASVRHPFRVELPAAQVWRVEAPRTPFVELRARLALRTPDARAVAASRVACALLEYRSGSRLYARLREASGAAYAFDTVCEESGGVSSIDVAMTVTRAQSVDSAAVLRTVLASLAAEGVDGASFDATRSLLVRRERGRLDTPYDRAFALLEAEGEEALRGELERPWLRALRAMTAADVSAWLAAEARVERATLFVTAAAPVMPDAAAMAAVFPGVVVHDDAPEGDVRGGRTTESVATRGLRDEGAAAVTP